MKSGIGLARSTLVVFTADHGDAVGSNGGVCNKGGLMLEKTIRIPLLMRVPGIPPGTTCDRLVSNLDLPSTILRMSNPCTAIAHQPDPLSRTTPQY